MSTSCKVMEYIGLWYEIVDCVQHEHADVMGVFLRNIVKKG